MQTILLGVVLRDAMVVSPRRNVFILAGLQNHARQLANPRDEFKYEPLSFGGQAFSGLPQ